MKLALELAARGRGFVEPNPMVGAVVVQQNEVVGLGWHEKFGGHHAEINALNQAGNNAKGSTLYVTLEPCCHHGKTPPCVDSIIRAGVSEVVFAMEDPNPLVAGKGLQKLQEQGIKVFKSLLEKDARFLNAPFIKSFN
ncbi:MAG: bifunctional diaminohydroxyphosphoribosylaminopyrimidine deaminase/5-amino-6-(5-phosphoribosylamino)uracil reductase RibD, partial [Gemmataceae bacterium]